MPSQGLNSGDQMPGPGHYRGKHTMFVRHTRQTHKGPWLPVHMRIGYEKAGHVTAGKQVSYTAGK